MSQLSRLKALDLEASGEAGTRNGMGLNDRGPGLDSISREVYCVLGIPIDAVTMAQVVQKIEVAVANRTKLSLATPNLHFLVNSLDDPEFRESLLESDLCPADGMPIIWVARLLGIPLKTRVAGSDIFQALKARPSSVPPVSVFFFGSTEDVAAAAARNINASSGLRCVGWTCPGFGSVEEMCADQVLRPVITSQADFLVAALGAQKGQIWLSRNHDRLPMPVQAHLGATINFQAGTIKRAPRVLQKLGLEWGWRILEEPKLWKRYLLDGLVFLRLLAFQVLPLAAIERLSRQRFRNGELSLRQTQLGQRNVLKISGAATSRHIQPAVDCFRELVLSGRPVELDFTDVSHVDARFLGLLLMLRKILRHSGRCLEMKGISNRVQRLFRLHGLGYLLG